MNKFDLAWKIVSPFSLENNKDLKLHILARLDNLIEVLKEEREFFEHGFGPDGGNWDRDEMLMAWGKIQIMDQIMNEFNETCDMVKKGGCE